MWLILLNRAIKEVCFCEAKINSILDLNKNFRKNLIAAFFYFSYLIIVTIFISLNQLFSVYLCFKTFKSFSKLKTFQI